MDFEKSIIQNIIFNKKKYFIKRDDLIHPIFNGNKIRKFYFLINSNYKRVYTYGGNQSNTIPAYAFFAKEKGIEVNFYTKEISKHLKSNPSGNYKIGLENINFIEIPNDRYNEETERIKNKKLDKEDIFINIGGHQKEAEHGIKLLAYEIMNWIKENKKENISVFLPSGTGTTALYLKKNLPIKVYTTPCVGDSIYLKKQFLNLEKNELLHPIILSSQKKYHFGKPYKELLDIYNRLYKETKIEFELLYDCVGWIVLEENSKNIKEEILYIHQGGTIGNESQLKRYKYLKISI